MQTLRSTCGTERPAERGTALALALFVLVFLITLTTSSVSVSVHRQSAARTARTAERVQTIADAGAHCALYELNRGVDLAADGIGVASGSLNGGTYTVTITPAFAGAGTYTIRSVANLGGVERRVEVVANGGSTPGPGFFGIDLFKMSGGFVDSYNSSIGSYAAQKGAGTHAGENANVSSNASITLSGGPFIYGDATPGPTGSVTGTITGITGSTAPASALQTVDPYVYTPPIAATGAISSSTTLNSGTYRYTQVTVGGGKTLTINGNVTLYCDGKFTTSGSGMILLSPGASVTIHHGSNDFTCSGSGIVNTDMRPANAKVYSASITKITTSGSGAQYATIYAPYAAAVVSGGGGVYGSLVAKTIDISGGSSMHQDLSLGGGATTGFDVVLMRRY